MVEDVNIHKEHRHGRHVQRIEREVAVHQLHSILVSLVNDAKSFDFATFTFSTMLLVLTAATSIWAATLRIAELDIMDILRFE